MTVKAETPTGKLRLIATSDLADAFDLSAAAGWNQTPEDWRMLLDLSPRGCFGIELEDSLVATTTIVCYGQQLAWIGMVLTKPEYRGRGFARRLLATALDYADSLQIKMIKLDATEQGRPLYERFGFNGEEPVERWVRPGASSAFPGASAAELSGSLLDMDREAFAADRETLLQALAARSAVHFSSTGFLFTRPGRTTNYLGPCVASNSQTARQVIAEGMSQSPDANWSWDLLAKNEYAVALAKEFGFTPQRHLTRMRRGKTVRLDEHTIYAIAGFELG
jgi:GNAT superfamily N-acetyltransferase